ncbi:MAG: hypothetical protein ACTSR1_07425 [Candidatus Heimdallarchaeota archaeon]
MIFEIGRWKVKKENSEKHLKAMQASVDFQKKNRERFMFSKSQFYSVLSENPEEEIWIYIDEYPDQATYQKWHDESYLIEIEMNEILKNWESTIIRESFTSFTLEVAVGNEDLCVK